MGFFSLKAICAICGKEVGLNRFRIGKTVDGKDIWKCPACTRRGGYVEIDLVTGRAKVSTLEETERRVKCNTCGHIYCYNGADIVRNKQNANMAKLNSIGAIASGIGGNVISGQLQIQTAQDHMNNIVDYSRCPRCQSSDIRLLSQEEYEREKYNPSSTAAPLSDAEKIKNFKELLDLGIITQEEFEAKKKQLLGL